MPVGGTWAKQAISWAARRLSPAAAPCEQAQTEGPRWPLLLLALWAGLLMGWCTAAVWRRPRRRRRRSDAEDVELCVLFCNPRTSGQSRLQPLSFGQDLKFLMRTLPERLYVEPAASLYTAHRALVRHRPRFLMYSGHTLNGSFAACNL